MQAQPPSKDNLLYTDLLSSVDQLLGDAGTCAVEDPGFESACGSPEQPVDLTALDCMALDFPLNGYDIPYGGGGGAGGGESASTSSSGFAMTSGSGSSGSCGTSGEAEIGGGWEARAVFAAVSTTSMASEDDEDMDCDLVKVRNICYCNLHIYTSLGKHVISQPNSTVKTFFSALQPQLRSTAKSNSRGENPFV